MYTATGDSAPSQTNAKPLNFLTINNKNKDLKLFQKNNLRNKIKRLRKGKIYSVYNIKYEQLPIMTHF